MSQLLQPPQTGVEDVLDVPEAVRLPLANRQATKPIDSLTKRIVQLLTIHQLELPFHNEDIAEMDDQTKRTLIRSLEERVDRKRSAGRTL